MVTRTYDRGFGEIVTFEVPELAAGLSDHDAWIVSQTLKGIRYHLGVHSEELERVLYNLGYRLQLQSSGTSMVVPRPYIDNVMLWEPGRRITFTYYEEQEKFLKVLRSMLHVSDMPKQRIINMGDMFVGYVTIVDVPDTAIQDALKRARVTAMVEGHVWGLE